MSAEALRVILQRRDGAEAAAFPGVDLAGAYEVQKAAERVLVHERGWKAIGYKIGATNPAARQTFGISEPFLGRLYREMTQQTPGKITFKAGFHRAVEAEYVIELARDLTETDSAYDAAAIKAATAAVYPAIEVIGSVFPVGGPEGSLGLIADFGGHAHQILGARVVDFNAYDLLETPIILTINGESKATGKGANVDGSPFASCAWLATKLAREGRPLRAGDIVTTGTAITPTPLGGGQSVVADFGAFGRVELQIA